MVRCYEHSTVSGVDVQVQSSMRKSVACLKNCFFCRENYLRFSSQIFSLENFHESLHLTNHAVQCKYRNVNQRDKALPDENMWDCHTFKAYLKQIGFLEKWSDVIMPGGGSKNTESYGCNFFIFHRNS